MEEQNTRDKILQALVAVASRDGASGLTLEKVAAAAGVSKGGLLYHFKSKRDLLHGLVEAGIHEFQDAVDRGVASGLDWLDAYAAASLASGQSDGWVNALLVPMLDHPELLDPFRAAMKNWYAQAGQTAGAAGQLLLLALDGLYLHQLCGLDLGLDTSGLLRAARGTVA